jgi:hypothetical protein
MMPERILPPGGSGMTVSMVEEEDEPPERQRPESRQVRAAFHRIEAAQSAEG